MEHKESKLNTIPDGKQNNNQITVPRLNRGGKWLLNNKKAAENIIPKPSTGEKRKPPISG